MYNRGESMQDLDAASPRSCLQPLGTLIFLLEKCGEVSSCIAVLDMPSKQQHWEAALLGGRMKCHTAKDTWALLLHSGKLT